MFSSSRCFYFNQWSFVSPDIMSVGNHLVGAGRFVHHKKALNLRRTDVASIRGYLFGKFIGFQNVIATVVEPFEHFRDLELGAIANVLFHVDPSRTNKSRIQSAM